MLDSGVEFSGIVDDEDDVGPVDEPLNHIVERIRAVDLLTHFENARNFNNVGLANDIWIVTRYLTVQWMAVTRFDWVVAVPWRGFCWATACPADDL